MKITAIMPWLVKIEGGYRGEHLLGEVRTDAGISGRGEITTTTRVADRAVAGMLRQLNDHRVGDDPTRIGRIWHKTFRGFTCMGARSAISHMASGIDIALWRIVGKLRDLPIYELLSGPVRDEILADTRPDRSRFTSDADAVKEIRAIVDAGQIDGFDDRAVRA